MSDYKSLLTMGGVSLVVSTLVVLVNNVYLYKHACKKSVPASAVPVSTVPVSADSDSK